MIVLISELRKNRLRRYGLLKTYKLGDIGICFARPFFQAHHAILINSASSLTGRLNSILGYTIEIKGGTAQLQECAEELQLFIDAYDEFLNKWWYTDEENVPLDVKVRRSDYKMISRGRFPR